MAKKNKEVVISPAVLSNLGDREKPWLVWSKAVFKGPKELWKPYRRYKELEEAIDCMVELKDTWPGSDFEFCTVACDPLYMTESSQPGDDYVEEEF